jgi:hypothetical protein
MIHKEPRAHDETYLARLRQLPCIQPCCGALAVDAAHIRMASAIYGATEAGVGAKPHDFWTLPLCRHHHELQHRIGTKRFWDQLGMDPHYVALRLYQIHQRIEDDLEALQQMRLVVLEERFAASST